jgi:hypothetical protein
MGIHVQHPLCLRGDSLYARCAPNINTYPAVVLSSCHCKEIEINQEHSYMFPCAYGFPKTKKKWGFSDHRPLQPTNRTAIHKDDGEPRATPTQPASEAAHRGTKLGTALKRRILGLVAETTNTAGWVSISAQGSSSCLSTILGSLDRHAR